MRIATLCVVAALSVVACSVVDAVVADDPDTVDVVAELVSDVERFVYRPLQPAPPAVATLRRHELTTSTWLPREREWLALVAQLFAARLDLQAVPRFTPVSVWAIGPRVIAAEVRPADSPALMAIPAEHKGVVAWYDDDGGAFAGPFSPRPVDYRHVSSPWGERVHPLSGRLKKHLGVDLSARTGTPVVAVADGVVVTRAHNGGAGNHLAIRHGSGVLTRSFHLDAFADGVVVGRRVKRGDVVGYVGATGAVTGPHLHFERWQHGRCLDPATPWPAGARLPKKQRTAHKALAAQLRAMTADDEIREWPPPSTSTSTTPATTSTTPSTNS